MLAFSGWLAGVVSVCSMVMGWLAGFWWNQGCVSVCVRVCVCRRHYVYTPSLSLSTLAKPPSPVGRVHGDRPTDEGGFSLSLCPLCVAGTLSLGLVPFNS